MNILVGDFLTLFPQDILAIHIKLSGLTVGMVLAVGFNVLDHFGQTEQVVHPLERHALGFGDKEPNEEEHGETECAVNEKGTATC
jgi:hypothetical protein